MRQRATESKVFRDSTRALTSAWVDANSLSSHSVTISFRQCFIDSIWPAIVVSSLANVRRICKLDRQQIITYERSSGTRNTYCSWIEVSSSPSLLYANLSESHKACRLSFSENVHSEAAMCRYGPQAGA